MHSDVFSGSSLATRLQTQGELLREPSDGREQRQSTGAADILTISDNPTLAVYLAGLFQKSGWTVAHARTCQEGLAFLKKTRAAVVVCEEELPDGFWHDAAAELNSLPDAPALVVISQDDSLAHELTALGAFDVLVRPLRESDVVWTIASAWHAWMKRLEESDSGAWRCSGA